MRNRFGPVKASVPPIGQGTWQLEHHHRSQVVAALGRGLEVGLTHVDTAEMYGDGSVEEMVGEAIEGRRDEVFLVSKVLPSNASRRGTVTACEHSLRRLRTDHLDLWQFHEMVYDNDPDWVFEKGGLKAALELQGFYGGPCRAPLGTPDGDAIEDIKEVLATAGLL